MNQYIVYQCISVYCDLAVCTCITHSGELSQCICFWNLLNVCHAWIRGWHQVQAEVSLQKKRGRSSSFKMGAVQPPLARRHAFLCIPKASLKRSFTRHHSWRATTHWKDTRSPRNCNLRWGGSLSGEFALPIQWIHNSRQLQATRVQFYQVTLQHICVCVWWQSTSRSWVKNHGNHSAIMGKAVLPCRVHLYILYKTNCKGKNPKKNIHVHEWTGGNFGGYVMDGMCDFAARKTEWRYHMSRLCMFVRGMYACTYVCNVCMCVCKCTNVWLCTAMPMYGHVKLSKLCIVCMIMFGCVWTCICV